MFCSVDLRGGMPCVDGVLFGRQAEAVEAHRVHHRFAAHPLEAADDVGGRVTFGMADVQAVAAGVRKHVEHVHFRAGRQPRRGERAVLFPITLPLRLDDGGVVAGHSVIC